jgi:hemoglobin
MSDKKDIGNREDLGLVLKRFYEKVFSDRVIGHFFTIVVPLNLDTHLPVITDFWEAVLFDTRGYRKNVMEVHGHIHALSSIEKTHLDQWVSLFTSTIDECFAGEKAELMKQRARSIATLMDIKLNHPNIR